MPRQFPKPSGSASPLCDVLPEDASLSPEQTSRRALAARTIDQRLVGGIRAQTPVRSLGLPLP